MHGPCPAVQGGCLRPGTAGLPGARKPLERRQQGPALTSGGSGYNGAAAGTKPRGPRSARQRGAASGEGGPKPGRGVCPPSLAPHGPPRRVGVGGCPGGGVWKEKRAKGRTYFPRGTRRQDSSSREVRV
ncbi:collagen alpha-1(I) chain-like [Piliocolobus tephrosceles]|uniref:collagen alpha-1(I) chain-like n=1 Tax=Piliocolobus tephrosceles TaxID=591936 RepID=UPI000E6B297A|nr:collagen alpha-1(I) chain-like [Piliocolobus tephrosceles]